MVLFLFVAINIDKFFSGGGMDRKVWALIALFWIGVIVGRLK
jgi:hypothetical protein